MSVSNKFISEMNCIIHGQEIFYRATTEEFPFYSEMGEKEATIYTFSYERTNFEKDARRPVLFAFNGGPGVSSAMVHIGALAPERVKMGDATELSILPPYEMEPNGGCILDICDIVVIDAIGTGYSRLLMKAAAKKYFGTINDCSSFVKVISNWLTVHDRWNSPVYLLGESYGTIRNAVLSEMLSADLETGCSCINLSGIVMLGSAFDHGQRPYPVDTPVLNFSSIAATYWYHNHREETLPEKEAFLKEANTFAYDEYLPALALGSRLSNERKEHIKERLSYFTGLDGDTLEDLSLRVDTYTYPNYAMADKQKVVGRYDGRFVADMPKSRKGESEEDPGFAVFMAAVHHCFNGIWKKKLNIDMNEEYRSMCNIADGWDFTTPKPVVESLAKAMKRIPSMKLMLGVGYYDMLTTPGFSEYTLAAFDLPKSRTIVQKFEAGHMPYLGSAECDVFGQKLREFIAL